MYIKILAKICIYNINLISLMIPGKHKCLRSKNIQTCGSTLKNTLTYDKSIIQKYQFSKYNIVFSSPLFNIGAKKNNFKEFGYTSTGREELTIWARGTVRVEAQHFKMNGEIQSKLGPLLYIRRSTLF